MRKATFEQGKTEISYIMQKYNGRMGEQHPHGVIEGILWSVAHEEGLELANALLYMFRLNEPLNGSHNWFEDGLEHPMVVELDSNYVLPMGCRAAEDDWLEKNFEKLSKKA